MSTKDAMSLYTLVVVLVVVMMIWAELYLVAIMLGAMWGMGYLIYRAATGNGG